MKTRIHSTLPQEADGFWIFASEQGSENEFDARTERSHLICWKESERMIKKKSLNDGVYCR